MQRLRHGLIRIVKGPTGGFLASLGIAAVLGGVALATPAPPVADVTGHHGDVVAAAPLGSYPTSDGAVVSGDPTVTGGVQTDADPTGRGPALDPTAGGPNTPNGGLGPGDGSSGGVRSAGLAPAHQDARDDPTTTGGSTREGHGHQGSGSGQGSGGNGYQGSGSGSGDGHGSGSGQGSGGHQRHKGTGSGSGGSGSGGSGSGGNGSGNRGDDGGSDSDGRGAGGSGSGGSGSTNTPNGHSTR